MRGRTETVQCDVCGAPLDEDGRCVNCAKDQWVADDRRAKADAAFVDDVPDLGHEG